MLSIYKALHYAREQKGSGILHGLKVSGKLYELEADFGEGNTVLQRLAPEAFRLVELISCGATRGIDVEINTRSLFGRL